MNTTVVKLNTLTDPVRAAAEDHDLRLVIGYRILIRRIVRGVIISAVLGAADMHALPGFFHAEGDSSVPHLIFRNLQKLA